MNIFRDDEDRKKFMMDSIKFAQDSIEFAEYHITQLNDDSWSRAISKERKEKSIAAAREAVTFHKDFIVRRTREYAALYGPKLALVSKGAGSK